MSPPDAPNEREYPAHQRGVVVSGRARAVRTRLATVRDVLARVFVGDRLGLVVFLGVLAFVGLYWRVGFFINDNYTLANALVSLAEGHLWVDEAVYGPGLETPGMNVRDGRFYGRNYGQLVFALPFLWALQALGTVADPGLILPMCWSLLVVALGRSVGRELDRQALGTSVGAGVGLVAFGANVAVARPLDPRLFPVAALQLGSVVAAGLAVATLYRLLTRIHGRQAGVAGAAVTALATPVGFWASIPKRHVTVVALVVGAAYALYRSREAASTEAMLSPLGFRASAYVMVGLLTWVHGGEAFAVFLTLALVDLPTARSNDIRSLGVIGAVFLLSMLPFFVTNLLVSGDPLRPPRMLRSFGTVPDTLDSGSGGGATESAGVWVSLVQLLPPSVAGVAGLTFDRLGILFGQFDTGLGTLVRRPGLLVSVFVRGGNIQGVSEENFYETIYLTVTEAAPVVAGVVAAGAVGVGRIRDAIRGSLAKSSGPLSALRSRPRRLDPSPAAVTDAFAVLCGLSFLVIYIPRLPVHAQVTVRYLLPLYPVAVYGLVRLPTLRRVLTDHWRPGLWAWAAGVLLGAQAFVVVVAVGSLGRGEALQVHAFVGLAGAALFAALAVVGVVTDRFDRLTAVAGGLAAALGTDLLLLTGLSYFQYGQYALPAAGWVADVLATA